MSPPWPKCLCEWSLIPNDVPAGSPRCGCDSPQLSRSRLSEPFRGIVNGASGTGPAAGSLLPAAGARMADFDRLTVQPGLAPMEAKSVDDLPDGEGWRYEPKWDGFRCLVFRDGGEVELRSKSGKPLGRYFPEIVGIVAAMKADRFVLDGELIIPVGGILSFDALQLRLHPAESRIRRLAAETPAQLMLFDCLETEREGSLIERPLAERRDALEALHRREKIGRAHV